MDNVHERDECDEVEGRRLLTAAFETVPVSEALAGELVRRVRRQDKTRRRVRTLVPAGAVAALGGAAAAAVTLTATVAGAPSAFAAVTAAAAKTSAASFTFTLSQVDPVFSKGKIPAMSGAFDPSNVTGAESCGGGSPVKVIFAGGHMYIGGTKVGQGKPWAETPLAPAATNGATIASGFSGDQPLDPSALLGLLKSSTSVINEGPTSGPGWTGTKYAFTVPLPKKDDITITGTVDVDSQGRVRRLATIATLAPRPPALPHGAIETEDVTFGGFGAKVSVAVPPASQVHNLGKQYVVVVC